MLLVMVVLSQVPVVGLMRLDREVGEKFPWGRQKGEGKTGPPVRALGCGCGILGPWNSL